MNYILSSCGTSLLTNQATPEEKTIIFKNANKHDKKMVDDQELKTLENIITKRKEQLDKATSQEAMKISAELNGILNLYRDNIPVKGDRHLLLSTDTWLGEETAKLVETWLNKNNQIVEVYRQSDLKTENLASFQSALSDLVQRLSDEIPGYSKSGYKIIFNLTGGFKSVQGFLQSIANFYADETVYIFETSSELLRIPKLPIKMDAESIIRSNEKVFRQLALDLPLTANQVKSIPETLLLNIDGQITLSPWGELLWGQTKQEIYQQQLLDEPIDRIKYSSDFRNDFETLPKERKQLINQRIDQLVANLQRGENLKSLDFKPIKGKEKLPSTHEMDAWSDGDAKRIYGHYEGNIFVLDQIGKALH